MQTQAPSYKDIMQYEKILPENFSGLFYFTNWSNEDFVAKWGGKEYVYPAQTTSPMVIPEHSPLEIQNIRKKFAQDLAEREFFKGNGYENLRRIEGARDPVTNTIQPTLGSMNRANSYSLDMLAPFIQKALEPLPVGVASIRKASSVELVEKLRRNEDGEIVTGAIKTDKDLEKLAKGEVSAKSSLDSRVLGN